MKTERKIDITLGTILAILVIVLIGLMLHMDSVRTDLINYYHDQTFDLQDQVRDLTAKNDLLKAALRAASSPHSTLQPYLLTYSRDVGASPTAELASNTCFYLTALLPANALKYEQSTTRLIADDNDVNIKVFYPQHLSAGETGQLIVIMTINGSSEPYTGYASFTALEDLHLINGDKDVNTYTGGGDLRFSKDGTVEIQFYSGATNEYNRPETTALLGCNNIRCSYQTY